MNDLPAQVVFGKGSDRTSVEYAGSVMTVRVPGHARDYWVDEYPGGSGERVFSLGEDNGEKFEVSISDAPGVCEHSCTCDSYEVRGHCGHIGALVALIYSDLLESRSESPGQLATGPAPF